MNTPISESAMDESEKKAIPDLGSLECRDRGRPAATGAELERIHGTALAAANAAVDVKGEDVKVLAMHGLVTFTDFMIIITGRNTRLTKRIAEEVAHRVKKEAGLIPAGTEGGSEGEWILVDFLDFVVHVFTPEAREFYRLEVLWKQAPVEEIA